ncbi:MAG: hypothetical protein A3D67_02060 [Candidatus Lloydbacteria bacterium RIFCSPHIGHO2_02_FULL_51_22]|uniref:Uncharacterized protein n=3 Tax=Candidatus Lloydiibacteriota TaxID=1817910 RepID=A0A1G2D7V3_9BACT|nr:MAG: hypothetical protein A3D67_02060 [Candidatus Lloydbacteria bacterium RIFCSPHIGHO2_02_FULL_51_22]OGZ15195.1 MAG: hypothetical protein A3J08_02990 [Candidatus Lloydbacteria bacterium RIFCSPLOWO2_02_FULL_51_11]OGZ16280.1 MAG: hypothetical protein A3G11_01110 [Candidatus Lloydbacteria bacterium RIFCSPLOWO2_12_FULL_51_9]
MSKESALIFTGIFIVIVPFLGVPNSVRTVLFVLSGVTVFFLALLIYAREKLLEQVKAKRRARSPKLRTHDSSENTETEK